MTADNKWSGITAAIHAASAVVNTVIEARKKKPPATDERIAVLEEKVRRLEEKA